MPAETHRLFSTWARHKKASITQLSLTQNAANIHSFMRCGVWCFIKIRSFTTHKIHLLKLPCLWWESEAAVFKSSILVCICFSVTQVGSYHDEPWQSEWHHRVSFTFTGTGGWVQNDYRSTFLLQICLSAYLAIELARLLSRQLPLIRACSFLEKSYVRCVCFHLSTSSPGLCTHKNRHTQAHTSFRIFLGTLLTQCLS